MPFVDLFFDFVKTDFEKKTAVWEKAFFLSV